MAPPVIGGSPRESAQKVEYSGARWSAIDKEESW
jgi:hypothetical protein